MHKRETPPHSRSSEASHDTERNLLCLRFQLTDSLNAEFFKEFTCSICLDLIVGCRSLSCGHSFCDECISNWLLRERVCNTSLSKHNEFFFLGLSVLQVKRARQPRRPKPSDRRHDGEPDLPPLKRYVLKVEAAQRQIHQLAQAENVLGPFI